MVPTGLFSSNTFDKMKRYFELAAIPFVSESAFYCIQGNYIIGAANEAWLNDQDVILSTMKTENSS